MDAFIQVIDFLLFKGEEPHQFGWYHILCIVLLVLTTTLLIIFFRKKDEKVYNRIVLIAWIIMVSFEVFKQIVFAMDWRNMSYGWGSFPFQFCSTPLFVWPLIIFIKGKTKFGQIVRDAALAFTATFVLFGGLTVYALPEDPLVTAWSINVQTMVHHGLQIAIGVFTAVFYYEKLNGKTLLYGVGLFVVCLIIAMGLNLTIKPLVVKDSGSFNLFYISPLEPCSLPILREFYNDVNNPNVAYPLFLMIYIFGFMVVAVIFYELQHWIIFLCRLFKNHKEKPRFLFSK